MSMVFCDSSVLVEAIKGNSMILDELLSKENSRLYVNSIVISEFIFFYLSLKSERSPLTLKNSKRISRFFEDGRIEQFLQMFLTIEMGEETNILSLYFMQKYNLLPNDAMILASCREYGVSYLATLDSDLKNACKTEGIRVIS